LKTIRIIKPGPQTTVQDSGRWGYQDRGVPVSGAMDQYALRLANLVVGNGEGEAALEITLGGLEAEFAQDSFFALAGAEAVAWLNREQVFSWRRIAAARGDRLTVDCSRKGARIYLALAGGIDVPPVMGSKSTYLRGGFGGYQGRALKSGDLLECGPAGVVGLPGIPPGMIPAYGDQSVLRVILGPQDEAISAEGLSTFRSSPYVVTQQADRMGCRLEGPRIGHRQGPDIISDGTSFGSIQVPGNGQPIILLADRQTTGGYVKIAGVISVDWPLIAQALPGREIRFATVSLKEARELYIQRELTLACFLRGSTPR
jgi:biotin-dependent carboxylase-like uncharacterized protein